MATGRRTPRGHAATLRARGWRLVGAGLALFAGYCTLVWFDVFGHNDDAPVCFGMPHRDWFFPPATVCAPDGGRVVVATSGLTTAAGTVLFLLAVGVLLAGLVLLVRSRRASHRRPTVRLSRPVPGTTWAPDAHSFPRTLGSTRSLPPTAESRDDRAPCRDAHR